MIKSQEDLRTNQNDDELQADVLDWLKEVYTHGSTAKMWKEKIKRLAQKLTKPGGEEKMRQKIQRYLIKVPAPFTDCDEESKEFRDQLPDSIIKKLKKVYLKPQKRAANQTSPVRIYRIEIPKHDQNSFENPDILISSIHNHLKDLPLKDRDFLGRIVSKEDIINSIVSHLTPHLRNRHNFDEDFKVKLKSFLVEILNEVPIEINSRDRTSHLNRIAASLINDITNINNSEYFNHLHNDLLVNEVNDFVAREVENIMCKLHLRINNKRLQLLEQELVDTLIKAGVSEDSINRTRENVILILQNLGGLSTYQAKYFANVVIKGFQEKCHNTAKKANDQHNTSLKKPYIDNYLVFHNSPKITSGATSTFAKENELCKETLMIQIEEWLEGLHIKIPYTCTNRQKAVAHLAEDIIDRLNYMKSNPSSKGSDESELQFLRYQIFKWINKVAGENTMETLDNAKNLMLRIHRMDIPIVKRSTEGSNEISSLATKEKTTTNNKHQHGIKYPQDSKEQKVWIRKFEDIIDAWIDSLLTETCNENVHLDKRNEIVHNFAVNVFDTLIQISKLSDTDNFLIIENMALKWLKELSNENLQKACVHRLVDSILELHYELAQDQPQNKNVTNTPSNHNLKHVTNMKPQLNSIREEPKLGLSRVTVYGVTLPVNSKEATMGTTDDSIREINEKDVEASLDLYLKQLIEQIAVWLDTLNIPEIHDKGFREIVVNDLAGDIIDRHKYLELNPSSRSTDENELEQLRYQIFKWINKLVGEEQIETVQRASELMNRIQSIPVPMLVKNEGHKQSACHPQSIKDTTIKNSPETIHSELLATSPGRKKSHIPPDCNNSITDRHLNSINSTSPPSPSRVRSLDQSGPLGFAGPMATTNQQANTLASRSPKLSVGETKIKINNKRSIEHNDVDVPKTFNSTPDNFTVTNESQPLSGLKNSPITEVNSHIDDHLPPGIPLDQVYQYFDEIFKKRIMEIPLQTPTTEQKMLADMAMKGLYNAIWKTYFNLKGDPEIENDYSYFTLMLEEKLDNMLDCLPETPELRQILPSWKVNVLNDVMTMLKYEHNLTDTPSFRQQVAEKMDRKFVKAQFTASSNIYQHDFVVKTADAYILYSKYKEKDPIKANIYRQRLMKKIEELADAVKTSNNVDFRRIDQAKLCQIAMQILESVPIPRDEIMKEEADEILVGEEIEQWYKALPVKPAINETHEILRKRMRELLAKKIRDIEKRLDLDETSAEMNLKHEVSKFLHDDACLQENEDLNIDFMIEELTNRLKTKRQQNMLGYETFEKETPFFSTFVQTDPGGAFPALGNIDESQAKLYDVEGLDITRTGQIQGQTGQVLPNDQNVPPCCQGQLLERSRAAEPRQSFAHNTSKPYQSNVVNESGPISNRMGRTCGPREAQQSQMIGVNGQNLYDQIGMLNRTGIASRPEVLLNDQTPCPVNQGYTQTANGSQLRMPSSQSRRPELSLSYQPPCGMYKGYNHNQVVDRSLPCFPSDHPQTHNRQAYIPSRSGVQPIIEQPYQVNEDYNQVVERNQARISTDQLPVHGPDVQPNFEEPYPVNEDFNEVKDRRMSNGHQASRLGQGQGSSQPQGPSTGFVSQDPTGPTRSTARVASPTVEPQEMQDEETDEEEVRFKCRCMERVWKCKKRHYCEDRDIRPRCRPRPRMPYPCGYFY